MSNLHDWFLPLRDDVMQGMYAHYQHPLQQVVEEENIQGWDFMHAQSAHVLGGLVRPADLHERIPYSAESHIAKLLSETAERGLLEPAGASPTDGYRLTARGRATVDRMKSAVDDTLAVAPIDATAAERATELLHAQVERCLGCDFDTPSLSFSRKFAPGPDAPVGPRLRRAVFDLNAFRDDAHVAAFTALDVPAHEWEAFSHVWGEKVWGEPVATAAEVAEKLSFRGYSAHEYREALENAVGRGWLAHEGERYVITEEGRRVREAAEADTDARYYQAWQLSADEQSELQHALSTLRDQLRESAPEPAAG